MFTVLYVIRCRREDEVFWDRLQRGRSTEEGGGGHHEAQGGWADWVMYDMYIVNKGRYITSFFRVPRIVL